MLLKVQDSDSSSPCSGHESECSLGPIFLSKPKKVLTKSDSNSKAVPLLKLDSNHRSESPVHAKDLRQDELKLAMHQQCDLRWHSRRSQDITTVLRTVWDPRIVPEEEATFHCVSEKFGLLDVL